MKYINARFRLSLDIHVIQRYRKIVLRNVEFQSWSNMIPMYVIPLDVELQLLDLDLGLLFFFSVEQCC